MQLVYTMEYLKYILFTIAYLIKTIETFKFIMTLVVITIVALLVAYWTQN